MKRILFGTLIVLPFLLASHSSYGQVELGLHGSSLLNNGNNQWGGGLFVKGFITSGVALGASARMYPKYLRTESWRFGGTELQRTEGNLFVPVTGTVDFYLLPGAIRLYVGSDVGLYYNAYFYKLETPDGAMLIDRQVKKSYFGVGPHVGVTIEGRLAGVFAQFQYNYIFGSGDPEELTIPLFNDRVSTNPTSSFTSFDVGVFLKLAGR